MMFLGSSYRTNDKRATEFIFNQSECIQTLRSAPFHGDFAPLGSKRYDTVPKQPSTIMSSTCQHVSIDDKGARTTTQQAAGRATFLMLHNTTFGLRSPHLQTVELMKRELLIVHPHLIHRRSIAYLTVHVNARCSV